MGIPKFFRLISERWPLISQLIEGNQVPEFDNLYLDMNSILHTCTARNKEADSSKRLTEDEVFSSIFAYIDHLFDTIKPKKVFYMAIDGVAPRAKMNQQRSRRFRTALDAEKKLKEAIEKGTVLPDDEPFDSNAITPGTEFMAKLTRYLKYFIHKKVSTDSRWRECDIILSGHEAPGEGEHKIMEFIRNKKALAEYNPNTRHCIYGLDADLIMLGLSSHEPHFALLREEVTFGRQNSRPTAVEEQNFYLLHISLVREYLEIEFQELKDQISFDYDFERILDDFILIMFVIGNDFLPNLPDLHLNKGAFPLLLETFKESLRATDGYLNDHGEIDLKRLGVWFDVLSKFELQNFEQGEVDLEWFNKQLEDISISGEKKRERIGKLALLKQQRKLVGFIKPWLIKAYSQRFPLAIAEEDIPSLKLPNEYIQNNLDFLKTIAHDLDLIITHSQSTGDYSVRVDIDGIDLHESDEEWDERVGGIRRILKRYEAAIILDSDGEGAVEEKKAVYSEKFDSWRDSYYKDKLEFSLEDEEKLKELTENYVEGLQWVLFYYYRGVQSWPWYYKYHYAPRISDVKKGLEVKINFKMGKPVRPFEQLMAVLPARSANLVPIPYRKLMTDEHSPIKEFYPKEVETDMNGKTADWEAVVKISFVDMDKLKEAMAPMEDQLTPEEKFRNSFGSDLLFIFNPQIEEVFKSPLPHVFTDLEHNHCFETPFKLKIFAQSELVTGLCEGALSGAESLAGFPTLKSIPFQSELKNAGLKIFQFPTRGASQILSPEDTHEGLEIGQFAKRVLGKIVYTHYPFLRESIVTKIIDGHYAYEHVKGRHGARDVSRPLDHDEAHDFKRTRESMRGTYAFKMGIELKDIRALVYVKIVSGLRRTSNGAYVKAYHEGEEIYPLPLVVDEVKNKDSRYTEKPPLPINEEFPIDSKVIFLGEYAYGGQATVTGYTSTSRLDATVVKMSMKSEPQFGAICAQVERKKIRYIQQSQASKSMSVDSLFFSRITSSYSVENGGQRVDVGLNLKFDSRRLKVIGYTRKGLRGWEYSEKAMNLIKQYQSKFSKFFGALSKLPRDVNIPKASNLSVTSDELKQIVSWLKSVKADFKRSSLESDALTDESIHEIENQIEVFDASADKHDTKKLKGVPTQAVLNPSVSFQKLRAQSFELGDRVVYVHDSGKVPIFSKGTVVAYTSVGPTVTLQVLFDKILMGGNKLGGKLRTSRGLEIDSSLVLNVSNRQYIYHSKASAQRKAAQKVGHIPKHVKTPGNKTPTQPVLVAKASQPVNKPEIADGSKTTPKNVEQTLALKPKSQTKNDTKSELLSLLKGDEKKEEKNGDTFEEEISTSDPLRQFQLKTLQASILSRVSGAPNIPPPMLMPQGFMPGMVPLGMPMGVPLGPTGMPMNMPPQQIPNSGPSAPTSQRSDSDATKSNGSSKNGPTRGRGGYRGRGRSGKSNSKPREKKFPE
jgi:5'-3' exoribonuclease 1